MTIKGIAGILREIKYFKSVMREYGDSLVRGKYHIHPVFRAISLYDPDIGKAAREYFDKYKPARGVRIASHCLNKIGFLHNKNKQSTEEYEAIYTANNYDVIREVKLFSFRRKKVLTVCTSNDEQEKQIHLFELLSGAYNMPRVKRGYKYPNCLEISMITMKDGDELNALRSIADCTAKYNTAVNNYLRISVKKLVELSLDCEDASHLEMLIGKIDSSFYDLPIPLCLQHGDLSKDNLIYGECDGKTDFWWIDWEHVGERIFFYDYFFYIVHSAMFYDMRALQRFVKGESDEFLGALFAQFGLEYCKDKRFNYLLIFMVAFFKERLSTKASYPLRDKYYRLVEDMELFVRGEKDEA